MTAATTRPVALVILDGWGHRPEPADNAVAQANTPVFDRLWQAGPRALLEACGEAVGLPEGQIGNSEVGHLNIGAGRVVLQDLPRITKSLGAGEAAENPAFVQLIERTRARGGRVHLMGLVSPGGVHSHQDHAVHLAKGLSDAGVETVIHAFTDGRDVPPRSGRDQLARFLEDIRELDGVTVGTVTGRYYAMDRDKRWDRVELAYNALVHGDAPKAADPLQVMTDSYAEDVTDEFVKPRIIDGYAGFQAGDSILFFNFRADRARQLLTAFLDDGFDGFGRRDGKPDLADACGMVEYSDKLAPLMSALYGPEEINEGLGEIAAKAGLVQLRAAETEKYPHVTFFFNGGSEGVYDGEERILEPSPKVATYDLQPEMSAAPLTDKVVEAIDSGRFDLVVLNFANPDMVGHTGSLDAAIKAVKTVDGCLGRVVDAVVGQGGTLFVTADHGNCEIMRDPETGQPHTAHTLDLVPALLVNAPAHVTGLADGVLADIAPTLVELLGLDQPAAMTGHSLIRRDQSQAAAE